MADAFANYAPGLGSPASDAFAIAPGADPLPAVTRFLYVGGTGDITVTMKSGASLTFKNAQAGDELDLRVTHVTAASATDLVGLTDPAAASDAGLPDNAVTYQGDAVTYSGDVVTA